MITPRLFTSFPITLSFQAAAQEMLVSRCQTLLTSPPGQLQKPDNHAELRHDDSTCKDSQHETFNNVKRAVAQRLIQRFEQ
jgi:hypothetical protein